MAAGEFEEAEDDTEDAFLYGPDGRYWPEPCIVCGERPSSGAADAANQSAPRTTSVPTDAIALRSPMRGARSQPEGARSKNE